MADITVALFQARFSEFTLDDALLEQLLEEAYRLSDTSEEATMYCMAHLCSLEAERSTDGSPDGGSGVVSEEGLGPQKIKYITQAEDGREAFFATTFYGRKVLAIEARTPKIVMGVVTA